MALDTRQPKGYRKAWNGGVKPQTCRQCGHTSDHHCDLDRPGFDHCISCDKMHHEFKPVAQETERGR